MKLKFKIKGLDCANCAAELERKINNNLNKEDVLNNLKRIIKKEEPDVTIEEV